MTPATKQAVTPAAAALDDLAGEIRREHQLAEQHFKSAVAHAVNAGELLIEAKGQVKHGRWLPWIKANFPGSEWTARNYMRLAANRERVADLPTLREALAALSKPKQAASKPIDIPAALAIAERTKAESDALRAKAGLPPVPETGTVNSWRRTLDEGHTAPTSAIIAGLRKVRVNYFGEDRAALDTAIAVLTDPPEAQPSAQVENQPFATGGRR